MTAVLVAAKPVILCARLDGEPRSKALRWYSEQRDHQYVYQPVMRDEYHYADMLASWWESDATIVNIEHDVERSDRLVRQLLACPQPLCTRPYRTHGLHNLFPILEYNRPPHGSSWESVEGRIEWAEWSAPGFVKIAAEARRRTANVRMNSALCRVPWGLVENAVNNALVPGNRWHVHWPSVEHAQVTALFGTSQNTSIK